MQNSNQPITKIEITQDKLVDILLHAATREDLAKLSDKLDDKIDKLSAKIDKIATESRSDFKQLALLIIGAILVPIALHFIK